MSQSCGCHHERPATTATGRAAQTVGELSRDPRALEVFQRLGINHCCGAHLPLSEAAAATGVPLEVLLQALDEAVRVPA